MTMQIIVATAAEGFKPRTWIKTDDRIALYLRTLANEGRDSAIDMDDAAILSHAAAVPLPKGQKNDDWEAWTTQVTEAIEAANDAAATGDEEVVEETSEVVDEEATAEEVDAAAAEETAGVDIRAEPAAAAKEGAREIAARLAGSELFTRELRDSLDAGERVKRAPLMLMLIVRAVFGWHAKDNPNVFDNWPMPNTTWKNKDNNPDKRKVSVRDVSTGEWKDKTVGHYDLIFSALPEGKRLDDEIAAINKRKADAVANIANKWRSVGDDVCKSEKKTREARRTAGRTLLRRAIALHMQFMGVKRDLPEITAHFMTVKDPKTQKQVPTPSTYPIVIREVKAIEVEGDAQPQQRFTTVSVTQFLGFKLSDALDPVKVKEKGSVYDAFIGSSGKGSGDEEPEAEGKQMDVEQAVDVLGLFAGWSENTQNMQLLRRRARADLAVVLSVCRAKLELEPLYQTFKNVYDAAEAGDEPRARALLANIGKVASNKAKAGKKAA